MNDATRADLHDALAQAVVVEQQLGLQYLYAAASLQWIPPADLAPDDPAQVTYEAARGAAKTLLLLARQEMEHQSWALNLLLATGAGTPAFDTGPMPMELPVGGPALLQPFSRDSLLRFIADERPDHLDDPAGPCSAPSDLQKALAELESTDSGYGTPDASAIYDHYAAIYRDLVHVELNSGPVVLPPDQQHGVQVVPDPVYGVSGGTVESFGDALAAIDQVVLEGEGGSSTVLWWSLTDEERSGARGHGIPADGPPPPTTMSADRSHYCRLVELWPLVQSGTVTVPVLEVPSNPALADEDDEIGAAPFEYITHPFSAEIVKLGEAAYGVLLDALRITYSANALDDTDAEAIHWTAYFQSMTMVIRPLLMVSARLPRHPGGGTERAGMTFRATDRFDGAFDGTCDDARRSVVARLGTLSERLGVILGDGSLVPEDTIDRPVVLRLLQGLQGDLLRIGENLSVDSSTPLGG
ncbi:MAG: hypothetical protein HKN41_13375 [Ilumatobacter sp.]|nr:hypothetical protein [Ilumatobacter sp.]